MAENKLNSTATYLIKTLNIVSDLMMIVFLCKWVGTQVLM